MSVEVFVDTNLLYYANTESPDPRHARARQLIEPLWSGPGKAAFDVQTRWKLGYWDSLIVAAAQRSGAPLLWSEDLAEGQRYDELRVMNPLTGR